MTNNMLTTEESQHVLSNKCSKITVTILTESQLKSYAGQW